MALFVANAATAVISIEMHINLTGGKKCAVTMEITKA